jgi:putative lipoic acid-binding regulatory protein
MEKTIISYPCLWSYRIIGQNEMSLRAAVAVVIDKFEHRLSHANKSSSGKYQSLNLEVHVNNETERLTILENLRKQKDIKFVL